MESLGIETPSFVIVTVSRILRTAWRSRTPAATGRRDAGYKPLADIRLIRSCTRQEYPHSLSYQEITLTQLPPTTKVIGASTIEERGSPLKSDDTSSCSSKPRYPFNGPDSDAFFSAAFTSSLVVFFSSQTTTSTTETLGVGTRMANPSSFPASSGITSLSALAAPVDVGIMLIAAARARRRSLCGKSRITWSLV